MSWRARKGWLPSCATNAVSSERGRPRRLVRWVAGSVMARKRTASAARVQLRGAEEIGNFACRGIGCIRAMHHVLLDARGKIGADGAGRSLLRIGGAHDVAVARDGALALQHLHEDRTRDHVAHQVLEERALAMYGVEALRLALRQVAHAGCDDRKAGFLEPAINLADEIGSHAVGLDDGQGALERHFALTSQRMQMSGRYSGRRKGRPLGKRRSLPRVPRSRQFGIDGSARLLRGFRLSRGL